MSYVLAFWVPRRLTYTIMMMIMIDAWSNNIFS